MRWSPLFSKSAALGLILAKHYCLKAIPILMADRIVENWGYRVVTKSLSMLAACEIVLDRRLIKVETAVSRGI